MTKTLRQTLTLADAAPDLDPLAAPEGAWNAAQNIVFRTGETARASGDRYVMVGARTPPRAMCYYTDAQGQGWWVYAGLGGIYVTDGVLHTDITPTGWAAIAAQQPNPLAPTTPASWTCEAWNGLVIINCSTAGSWYWPGQTTSRCLVLPGFNTAWRCLALRGWREFIFAVGMLNDAGMQRVRWSDAAEPGQVPGEWVPDADNMAGFFDLMPSSSPCLDAIALRDQLLVLKGETAHTIQYVGGTEVMAQRQIFADVGIVGPNAWARGGNDRVLFLTPTGDLQLTDGSSHESVAQGKSARALRDELDPSAFWLCCGGTLQREEQALIGFPAKGKTAATRAAVYDWRAGGLGFRDLADVYCMAPGRELQNVGQANVWDGDAAAFNSDSTAWNQELQAASLTDLMFGNETGFHLLDAAATGIGGAAIEAYAVKLGLSFGDAQRRKMVQRFWPWLRGRTGDPVTFRFGGQDAPDGPVTWSDPVVHMVGQADPLDSFVQGRFLAVEVTSTGGARWSLAGMDLEFSGAGKW